MNFITMNFISQFKILFLCCLIAFLFSSCDSADLKDAQDLTHKVEIVSKLFGKTLDGSKDIAAVAGQQADKVFQVEYKVLDFSKLLSAEELSTQLMEVGKDRWDCFNVQGDPEQERYRVFCKRMPLPLARELLGVLKLVR